MTDSPTSGTPQPASHPTDAELDAWWDSLTLEQQSQAMQRTPTTDSQTARLALRSPLLDWSAADRAILRSGRLTDGVTQCILRHEHDLGPVSNSGAGWIKEKLADLYGFLRGIVSRR